MFVRLSLLAALTCVPLAARAGAPASQEGPAKTLAIESAALTVMLDPADGTLAVVDRRTGQHWRQKPLAKNVAVKGAQSAGDRLRWKVRRGGAGPELDVTLTLDGQRPEFVVELAAEGDMPWAWEYPHPFVSEPGSYLVVPMNEGISYPVDDKSIQPMWLAAYGGHGICMAFWGVTDGTKGHMAILETPDDAVIRIARAEDRLTVAPVWESQKRRFGYARRVRYVFFDQGGHVGICKRYRAYAKQIGLWKSLEEKRKANPNIDLLIGAVNVWNWDRGAVDMVRQMQAAGIERILWSNAQSPEDVRAMNELGVLTSRYDIYQDVMDPKNFPKLGGVHPDWTTEAWPKDLMLGPDGDWIKGWGVKGKDGQWYSCGVLCDRLAPDYARRRIPADLKARDYRCRFIDTTTASPWRECYDPNHPLTRGESRHWKMELLRYVSQDAHLVTGCETGHDAAVPFVDYFEGMLSLGPYRIDDSGRAMQQIVSEVPDRVAKFQVGHAYRLPLWELVYHECVVAQWYWGDYNNKLPSIWDKRDLFNLLYGTPPMFMFRRDYWEQNKDRFVQSYRNVCPTVRSVGYAEMTDHRFLTPDRNVQQTAFANGVTITVNFGATPYQLPGGVSVAAGGFHVGK
ncbi:MAG: glycoside hydrolase [Pirellulales bacterium]